MVWDRKNQHMHGHTHRTKVRYLQNRTDHISAKVLEAHRVSYAMCLGRGSDEGMPSPPMKRGAAKLTSKTSTFQIGWPSFRIGAAGAKKLPFAFASFPSVGSASSLRLRIFLIDTS